MKYTIIYKQMFMIRISPKMENVLKPIRIVLRIQTQLLGHQDAITPFLEYHKNV